jgi:hypothetical protein
MVFSFILSRFHATKGAGWAPSWPGIFTYTAAVVDCLDLGKNIIISGKNARQARAKSHKLIAGEKWGSPI